MGETEAHPETRNRDWKAAHDCGGTHAEANAEEADDEVGDAVLHRPLRAPRPAEQCALRTAHDIASTGAG
jgi:hypothetical protein